MKDFTRLFDIIHYQKAHFEQPDAFAYKSNGQWKQVSTQNVIDTANKVSLALLKLGVKPDDKIAIVSNNRPEWNMVDIGILQVGAVNVPVYPTITEHEYKFIFNDAQIKYVFVSDKNLFTKISNIKSEIAKDKGFFQDLPKELKSIFPNIKQAVLSETYTQNRETNESDKTFILNIVGDKKISDKELAAIEGWLKIRTKQDNVKIFQTN